MTVSLDENFQNRRKMVGTKLYYLIKDLTKPQLNNLLLKCRGSNDKRLNLFKNYLLNHENTLEKLNVFLNKEVKKTWPNSTIKEQELKTRRLANFYSILIEKIILEVEYLEKTSSFRNILLANSLIKNGNIDLVNTYFDKAYLKSIEEDELIYQTSALKGKISMVYASQSDKKIEKVFEYNETLLNLNQKLYFNSIINYYNNVSNIYLEKSSLINESKEKHINEIKKHLQVIDCSLLKSSLLVSLAKLNFENENLFLYLEEAKEKMSTIENKNKSYYDFKRKMNFLELRLNFFRGKEVHELLEIANKIVDNHAKFSIINNNTLFYKILFLILDEDLVYAQEMLDKNQLFFKGDGKILEQFLKAVICEKTYEYRKATQILQNIIYSTNYFFSIFSRLMLIKIYTKQGKFSLLKSLIDSTQRYLIINKENPLGYKAHQYVLNQLKSSSLNVKSRREEKEVNLTIFHKYLLN